MYTSHKTDTTTACWPGFNAQKLVKYLQKKTDQQVRNRVSSDKGKSFDENFAFFAFRSLAKNAKIFSFFREISLESVLGKNAKKEIQKIREIIYARNTGEKDLFCAINCFS